MIRPNTDQERFYNLLKLAGDRGLAVEEIVGALYADRVDGGPTWARTSIHVMKTTINRKLKLERIETAFGYNWKQRGRGRYLRGDKPRYRLVSI